MVHRLGASSTREEAEQLALQGRERVRQHFLLPRLLLDDLLLIGDVLSHS
jgi:hypothetical protein